MNKTTFDRKSYVNIVLKDEDSFVIEELDKKTSTRKVAVIHISSLETPENNITSYEIKKDEVLTIRFEDKSE
jgi:hypothetical protein